MTPPFDASLSGNLMPVQARLSSLGASRRAIIAERGAPRSHGIRVFSQAFAVATMDLMKRRWLFMV